MLRRVIMERLGIRGSDNAMDLFSGGTMNMVFQPIVETWTGNVYGFEALLRGASGESLPLPDTETLFSMSETSSDLLRLDMACVGSALKSAAPIDEKYFIFINIHSQTLKELSRNTEAFYFRLIELGIDPARVVFEISERTEVSSIPQMAENIHSFLGKGIRIAIDDVGGSFRWLHHMLCVEPVFLKVDKSFVRDIADFTSQQALLKSLSVMAEKMDMSLIAEGVESPEALLVLEQCGVDFAQGYFFGRPQPVDSWLTSEYVNLSSGVEEQRPEVQEGKV